MRTNMMLDGKKISKKKACEVLGKECVETFIKEAKESFYEDPYQELSWWTGRGMLVIEFR